MIKTLINNRTYRLIFQLAALTEDTGDGEDKPQPTESLAASFGASASNSVYLQQCQYRPPPVSPQYLRARQPTALVARLFPHLQSARARSPEIDPRSSPRDHPISSCAASTVPSIVRLHSPA